MDDVTPGDEQATLAVVGAHDPTMPAEATEDQMLAWLWRHFAAQSWAAIPQVTVAMTDLAPVGTAVTGDAAKDRRIDMLMARKARNPDKYGHLETMAVEVKVTRADFMGDVRNPNKQAPWRSAASRHVYAVPAGLVQADETPAGSGLLWVRPPAFKGGVASVEWVRRPPSIPGHKPALPFRVLLTMLYRLSTHDAVTRGWGEPTPGERSTEDLRAELVAARTARDRADRDAMKALEKAESWRKAFALAGGGVPCGTCGRPLKPLRPKGGNFSDWRHQDPTDLDPCATMQRDQAQQAARDAYDQASDVERERQVRNAHRYGFKPDVEYAPWHAFLPYGWEKPDFRPADDVPDDPAATSDTA